MQRDKLLEALEVQVVWEKGIPVAGSDPALWRRDAYGTLIYRWAYGNRMSEYGWEKDHIWPSALGGLNSFSNYRPVHWRNNVARQANPFV